MVQIRVIQVTDSLDIGVVIIVEVYGFRSRWESERGETRVENLVNGINLLTTQISQRASYNPVASSINGITPHIKDTLVFFEIHMHHFMSFESYVVDFGCKFLVSILARIRGGHTIESMLQHELVVVLVKPVVVFTFAEGNLVWFVSSTPVTYQHDHFIW